MTAPLRLGLFAAAQVAVFAASFAVASAVSPDATQRPPANHDRDTHGALASAGPAAAMPDDDATTA